MTQDFLIYDENVSLEAFKTIYHECAIKMYYSDMSLGYIIINIPKDDLILLIDKLIEINKYL